MKFFDKIFNRNTNYRAGYCLLREIPMSATVLATPDKFVAPASLDFRDMCIETSDQGDTPHCSGFSSAGYVEVQNWRVKHYPEQIDGSSLYYEAKKHDGYSGDGTFPYHTMQAAVTLGYISGNPVYVERDRNKVKFAIHGHSVCVGAFMITDEWNSVGNNGVIPNWTGKTRDIGGHAVLICGYNSEGVYIQNSWGPMWGYFGFCFLSWEQFDKQFQNGMVIA